MAAKRELKNVSPLIADNAQITLIPKRKRQRVWEIDFLRGVCVILMILDHLTILISDIFGPQWYGGYNRGDAFTKFCFQWYNGSAREIIHPLVLFVFFSISGISCTFSRNNAKRGLMLGAVALLYTLGSYIAQNVMGISGVFVAFGVLDFLAVSMLLYAFVSFITRDNRWGIAGVSVILIVVTLVLYFCYTPPETTPKFFAWIFPPHDFYGNPSLFYNAYEFSPGDLFTMIPYTAFYFAGALIGELFYYERLSLVRFELTKYLFKRLATRCTPTYKAKRERCASFQSSLFARFLARRKS
ncbi:MAG: DUF1624 domain-containing protein [Christensenella sp.]|nr:MAG: DUF1624 domain-containing protein [Christensenella sp.]